MATIVRHLLTGEQYILLGTGYGIYRSSTGGYKEAGFKEGRLQVLAVANKAGAIQWFKSNELIVEFVDGQRPDTLI